MSVDKIIKINARRLLESGLSFETYFVLFCIVNTERQLLEDYVKMNGRIDKSRFMELMESNYISIENLEEITFGSIKATEKAKDMIGFKDLDHTRFFEELKQRYPKKGNGRTLQRDNARSKKLYKEIVTSEEMHEKILKCIDLYVNEHKKTNSLQYLQMLPTFLQQRNYEEYLELVDKGITGEEKTNISAI